MIGKVNYSKKLMVHRFARWRFYVAIFILAIVLSVVIGRLLYLDITEKPFLIRQATAESSRIVTTKVFRGIIYDGEGTPLAISAPIDNIIFNPKMLLKNPGSWQRIANNNMLGLNQEEIKAIILKNPKSQFVYVQKGLPPHLAASITDMHINGVYAESLQNSYFPEGAAAAQLIGFTNLDNKGQSALELAYTKQLNAQNGKTLDEVGAHGSPLLIKKVIQPPLYPKNLSLSLDSRLQFMAFDALKKEVHIAQAKSGSVVVLDPYTGEVLAAVSYPSFNPNLRDERHGSDVKDRAITDIFEPGSVMKAFTLAAALESGKYNLQSTIATAPGYYFINGHRVRDDGNYGTLDFAGIMQKSSNVGASKVALSLPRSQVYDMFSRAGFGQYPGGKFPSEASGTLPPLSSLSKFEFATMTFGYHLNSSLLQLARGYAAIANGGTLYPISFVKLSTPPVGKTIMSAKTAKEMRQLLHSVVGKNGTGLLSNVPGYAVGGKTGTTNKVGKHGYDKVRTNAVFVGLAPIGHPLFVIAVRINEAMKAHIYRYGGVSAAPVFAEVAGAALRLRGVPPTKDKIDEKLFVNQVRFYKLITQA